MYRRVDLFVKLDQVADNTAVAVLQGGQLPSDRHHVGRLEAVRDVGRSARRRPLRRGQQLHRFLAVANLIASGYPEFVVQAALQSLDEVLLHLDAVQRHACHGVAVLGAVAQPVALQFAEGVRRSGPDHLHRHRRFLFDDLEADLRSIGYATGRAGFFGQRARAVALSSQRRDLHRVRRVRLEATDRVLLQWPHVVA